MDKNLAKKPLSLIYMVAMIFAFASGVGALYLAHNILKDSDYEFYIGFAAFLVVCGVLSIIGEILFGPKWNPETEEWEK